MMYKSEKYYLVNEEELLAVVSSAIEFGQGIPGSYEQLNISDADCRAYPVDRVTTFDPETNECVRYWREV